MDETMNETTEMNDVTMEEDEYTPSYSDEGSFLGTALVIGGSFLLGVVVDKFVAPAVGNALNTAREGIVKMLTNGDENKGHYVVESDDSKVVEMKDSTK